MKTREIKFRAWNKKVNIMIDLNAVTPLALAIDPAIVGAGVGVYVPDDNSLIIEQYTGLKDKNGKEDWLGDIAKAEVGGIVHYREIVQAESGAFCISLPTMGASSGESLIMLITCEHENVGNIHENPKLLEKT